MKNHDNIENPKSPSQEVSNMNIPGFTAETTLYKRGHDYRQEGSAVACKR